MTDLQNKSDLELMRLYRQQGSLEAFKVLYQRHHGKVMGYISKKIQPNTLASEVFQDVFLRLHKYKNTYDESIPFSAWLFILVKSSLADAYRRDQKHRNSINIDDIEIKQESADISNETIDLSSLTEDERGLIQSRFFKGDSYRELSARLNKSEVSLRKKVSRILKKIKLKLEGKYE